MHAGPNIRPGAVLKVKARGVASSRRGFVINSVKCFETEMSVDAFLTYTKVEH